MTPQPPPCGCYVTYPKVKGKESIVKNKLVYCPLHTAAPALRDALEKISKMGYSKGDSADHCARVAKEALLTSCREKGTK